ncbi:MAG: hypothetical protein JXP34_15280 [Planctomycetes bacterium]|nr:hypothetical protein [Planctomycetota bacterium]
MGQGMAGNEGETRDFPQIPGYEILERAGRSAFGACYRARQVSMDRVVTVKVVPASRAGDVRRLRREIQLLVRLAREELVGSIDEGTAEEVRYFVHERPEGETLEALAARGLAWREAVDLGVQLARFLDEIHREGIALREIHPANLIRTPDGRWRLTSLEMASPFGADPDPLRTVGSPSFVAPELLRKGARPTVGSDLFALGAVIFFAATGRPPYAGTTVGEVLESAAKAAGPESTADLKGAPRDLDRVLTRLLATAPESRYTSGRTVRADLERIGRGRTIERRRTRVTGWLFSTAIAAALVGVAAWLALRPPEVPPGPGPEVSGSEKPAPKPDEPVAPPPEVKKGGKKPPSGKDSPEVRAWSEVLARVGAKGDDPCDDYYTVKAFLDAYGNGEMALRARAALRRAKEGCDQVTVRDFDAVKQQVGPALLKGRYGEVEARMEAVAKRHETFEGGALARDYVQKARAQCEAEAKKAIEKARALAGELRFDEALDVLTPLAGRAVVSVKAKLEEAIGEIRAERDRRLADDRAFAEARAGAVPILRERRFADAASRMRDAARTIRAEDLVDAAKEFAERADAAGRGWKALIDGIAAAKGRRKIRHRDPQTNELIEIEGEIRSVSGGSLTIKRWERTEEVVVPLVAIDARDLASLAGATEPGSRRSDLGWAFCFGGLAQDAAGFLLDESMPGAQRAPIEALIREFLILQDREALAGGLRAADELVAAGEAGKAEDALAALVLRYAKSPAYPEAGKAVETRFATLFSERRAGEGLGAIAHGKVIPGKDGSLVLRYEFQEEREELDWSPAVRRKVTNGVLSVIGRTVLLPGAPDAPGVFRGSISVRGVAIPTNQARPNVNVAVWAGPKKYEILFGLGYQPKLDELKLEISGGGFVSLPANVVLGIDAREAGEPKATVIGSRSTPRLVADKRHRFTIEAKVEGKGARAAFFVERGEFVFSGDLASQFPPVAEGTPEGTIAIETCDSPVFFAGIEVEGVLNPAWLDARLRARAEEALARLRGKAPPRGI